MTFEQKKLCGDIDVIRRNLSTKFVDSMDILYGVLLKSFFISVKIAKYFENKHR